MVLNRPRKQLPKLTSLIFLFHYEPGVILRTKRLAEQPSLVQQSHVLRFCVIHNLWIFDTAQGNVRVRFML